MDDNAVIAGPRATSSPVGARAWSELNSSGADLYWLPFAREWAARVREIEAETEAAEQWRLLVALANTRLDFVRTNRVDHLLKRLFDAPPSGIGTKPVRLAVLSSSTIRHLLPAIRVAALRRGIWLTTYEGDYGQYLQELADPGSGLHAFRPNAVLFAFDAYHLLRGADPTASAQAADAIVAEAMAHLRECWRLARDAFRCPVIQQTVLPVFPPLLGSNEHRLPGSRHRITARLNETLRETADAAGVDLLAVDAYAATHGLPSWHDPALWHRAKQEINPLAAPLYGDLVSRLLAAQQGRSYKCLVLDLDNTLWGGVIGDDGLEGIVLGQGGAAGEAFLSVQHYALDQAKRGVILAVCSKNDEANALAPFEKHPDMVLKRRDIACFVANWEDKARNIRRIAKQLNIGLDSLVFLDDNPFERELVRSELPMVAVPEVPEDPALVARCLADAGYFEGLVVTDDDRERTRQYQANAERVAFEAQAADLPAYLRGLEMTLVWSRFDRIGLQRIVQLINKTNQFNLTTRRYTEAEVVAVMEDKRAFGLQFRLLDRFGDNGIIGIVIGRAADGGDVVIDTWLMSCRVLGRQVEEAMLNLVADAARRLDGRRLIGEYRPTAKNGMVREHYGRLGFAPLGAGEVEGSTLWALDLGAFAGADTFIAVKGG